MNYRVMGQMEGGGYHCFEDSFATEQSACKWCESHEDQYPETYLFVEAVPTPCELIYGQHGY
jgi:hypothetical protein